MTDFSEEYTAVNSGFITIVGRPNVGKSSLLNLLAGQKVAIVSNKPQTTRQNIRAIINREDAQVVVVDTPGIHKPKHQLGRYMVDSALGTLKEMDLILFIIEAQHNFGPGDDYVLRQVVKSGRPVILVINKVDLIPKPSILPLIDEMQPKHAFAEIIPLSARTGENTESLLDVIISYMPKGPRYYPEDVVSDQPRELHLAELVREKVLHLTAQEVPHSVAVVVEEIFTGVKDVTVVRANIFVERDSQKAILIGEGGRMLKKIGQMAREEIEKVLGEKIYLELWVKVKTKWRKDPKHLYDLGFHND